MSVKTFKEECEMHWQVPVTIFQEYIKSFFLSNVFISELSIQVRWGLHFMLDVIWPIIVWVTQPTTAMACLGVSGPWSNGYLSFSTTSESCPAVIYNELLFLQWQLDVWQVVSLAAHHLITLLNFASSRSVMKCLHLLLHHLSFLWPVLSDRGMPFFNVSTQCLQICYQDASINRA